MNELDALPVAPGDATRLAKRDPSSSLDLENKVEAVVELQELVGELAILQNHLFAEAKQSLLVVLQGMDASGKDGTIRRVFTGVNPQGCDVSSFKAPSHDELAHDYLWRVHARCPRRGEIGIWNRSHYEDVVTVRVRGLIDDDRRKRRLGHVCNFEELLHDEGTTSLKLFLHISRDEQRRRLQKRLDDPEKRWKFDPSDLEAREEWNGYQAAYEEALTATSTKLAPWYVVPADSKWVRDVAVARLLVTTLREMRPQVPPPLPSLDHIAVV
ncbi:MAG: polyphosphate kinase 2 family protein [Acidimicrobiia bacterium]